MLFRSTHITNASSVPDFTHFRFDPCAQAGSVINAKAYMINGLRMISLYFIEV